MKRLVSRRSPLCALGAYPRSSRAPVQRTRRPYESGQTSTEHLPGRPRPAAGRQAKGPDS